MTKTRKIILCFLILSLFMGINIIINTNVAYADGYYTVTYDCNGGKIVENDGTEHTNTVKESVWGGEGAFYSDSSFAGRIQFGFRTGDGIIKDGYIFDGWKVDGVGDVISIKDYVLDHDITLVAQWSKIVASVTYDSNGGYWHNGPYTTTENAVYQYSKAQTIQLIGLGQPNRPYNSDNDYGYLIGWKKKGGGDTIYPAAEYIDGKLVGGEYYVDTDVTFVAVWGTKCDKYGHSYDEGKVTKSATCTEKGVKTYTCTECGKTTTEDIDANGHTEVTDPAVAATTTSTGLTEGSHCSVCGATIKRQVVIPKVEENKDDDDTNRDTKDPNDDKKDDGSSESSSSGSSGGSSSGSGSDSSGGKKSSYSSEWVDGKWYNADGSQTYAPTMTWMTNGSGWWIQDTNGWYPTSTWQKINGTWYYFKADGYMAENEWIDGWWINGDGSCTYGGVGSWQFDGYGWWYQDTYGWYPTNSWQKIDGYWYYFKSDGYMATSQYIDGYWVGADGVCR